MNDIIWITFPPGWYTPILTAVMWVWALAMLLDPPNLSREDS